LLDEYKRTTEVWLEPSLGSPMVDLNGDLGGEHGDLGGEHGDHGRFRSLELLVEDISCDFLKSKPGKLLSPYLISLNQEVQTS